MCVYIYILIYIDICFCIHDYVCVISIASRVQSQSNCKIKIGRSARWFPTLITFASRLSCRCWCWPVKCMAVDFQLGSFSWIHAIEFIESAVFSFHCPGPRLHPLLCISACCYFTVHLPFSRRKRFQPWYLIYRLHTSHTLNLLPFLWPNQYEPERSGRQNTALSTVSCWKFGVMPHAWQTMWNSSE